MLPTSYTRWRIRTATGLTWAVAAAAAVYWGLRLSGPVGAAPAAAPPPAPVAAADAAALARLLGAVAVSGPSAPPPSSLASRMQLQGVIVDRRQAGTALIAVDGKPARPYRTGVAIEPGLVVLALGHRSATLGAAGGPATATLEMPPLPSLAPHAPGAASSSGPALPSVPVAAPAYGASVAPPPLVLPPSAPLGGSTEPAAPITN